MQRRVGDCLIRKDNWHASEAKWFVVCAIVNFGNDCKRKQDIISILAASR